MLQGKKIESWTRDAFKLLLFIVLPCFLQHLIKRIIRGTPSLPWIPFLFCGQVQGTLHFFFFSQFYFIGRRRECLNDVAGSQAKLIVG